MHFCSNDYCCLTLYSDAKSKVCPKSSMCAFANRIRAKLRTVRLFILPVIELLRSHYDFFVVVDLLTCQNKASFWQLTNMHVQSQSLAILGIHATSFTCCKYLISDIQSLNELLAKLRALFGNPCNFRMVAGPFSTWTLTVKFQNASMKYFVVSTPCVVRGLKECKETSCYLNVLQTLKDFFARGCLAIVEGLCALVLSKCFQLYLIVMYGK